MIVADASVVVDYLLGGPSPAGDALADSLRLGEPVLAPHLVDVETTQVLRRYTRDGTLPGREATALVGELTDLPIRRYPHVGILERAFALREDVTVYDAIYLALAEAVEATLLTADQALENVPGCTATVQAYPTA